MRMHRLYNVTASYFDMALQSMTNREPFRLARSYFYFYRCTPFAEREMN